MKSENLELQFVSESIPQAECASDGSFDGSQKPRLTNCSQTSDSKKRLPIDPGKILYDIEAQTGGWPKSVASELVVTSTTGKLEVKKNEAQFFAWLYEHLDVDWLQSPGISKREFFEFCRCNAEKYRDATEYPHFPPIEGVLYRHRALVDEDGEALEEFLNFFSPATDHDRQLISLFLMTMAWGGPPGARPGFLITTNDSSNNQGRGWGKTTLLETCSALFGGTINTSHSESNDALKKRILCQSNHEPRPRVIAFDNVKSRRFSSADFEALITSHQISGHAMYRGNGAVPNFHTVGITINGASLSKDLAQRCVIIHVAKPDFSQGWQQELNDFVKAKQWSIIGDIIRLLRSEGFPISDDGSTRWACWESEVLAKVNNSVALRELIKTRQASLDDDSATGAEFIKHLQENRLALHRKKNVAKIDQDRMHQLLQDFLGLKMGKNIVTKTVLGFGLRCLHQVNKPGKSRSWLFRLDGKDLTQAMIKNSSW